MKVVLVVAVLAVVSKCVDAKPKQQLPSKSQGKGKGLTKEDFENARKVKIDPNENDANEPMVCTMYLRYLHINLLRIQSPDCMAG